MKGYKATYNFKCRNQTYKVGKTYTSDKLEMCKHGFHFCKDMKYVLGYYEFNENFVLLEVEVLGKIETDGTKSVTDKLKVLRVVPYEEYTFKDEIPKLEFDDGGNKISETYPNGETWTYEYDERGNKISETDYDGDKWIYEYDERGNKISETYPNGDKYTFEYDERGNLISKTYPDGDKYTYEYDERGNKISTTNPYGGKIFFKVLEQTIVTEED